MTNRRYHWKIAYLSLSLSLLLSFTLLSSSVSAARVSNPSQHLTDCYRQCAANPQQGLSRSLAKGGALRKCRQQCLNNSQLM